MEGRSNYHSHSLYCDGRAGMEDFVRFAVSSGFTSYGFSSHAPLPFPTAWTMEWDRMDDYLAEFRRLKERRTLRCHSPRRGPWSGTAWTTTWPSSAASRRSMPGASSCTSGWRLTT